MDLTQKRVYPRSMYHRNFDEPKMVNSRVEEAEASTKGWITTYIYKEFPKMVDGKIVRSLAEERQLLGQPEAGSVVMNLDSPVVETIAPEKESLSSVMETFVTEDIKAVKEIQDEGVDTAVVKKPEKPTRRPRK